MVYKEPTIRLKLGSKNSLGKFANLIDCGGYEYEGMVTSIKDVSIILYCLCGQGVTILLSKELGKRLGIPYKKVNEALSKIIQKYYKMDDLEAYLKTFPNTSPDAFKDTKNEESF